MTQKKLLGEIMVEMGLAPRDLVVECLNMQTEIHRKGLEPVPLGKLLVKTGCVTISDLDRALERQAKYHLTS